MMPEFEIKLEKIAKANNVELEQIKKLWVKYSNQCSLYDQSACLPEFCNWNKLKDIVSYQEVA